MTKKQQWENHAKQTQSEIRSFLLWALGYIEPESVTPERRSAQAIDSSLLPKNWGEPMGAPAIFEKQIEIKLLHPTSTLESRIQVETMHTKIKHTVMTVIIFIVEILVATVFSDIRVVRVYIGDFLVVILLYHGVKIFRDVPPFLLAMIIFLFACTVEILQYFHVADLLGLPPGSLLRVIVGTSFSWPDIGMYFLGCLTAYAVDSHCFFTGSHQSIS